MSNDPIDDALAEIDLLAVAEAVGVYRGGPIELGPDDPAIPDTEAQRERRRYLARQKARHIDRNRRSTRALDDVICNTDREKTFGQVRDLIGRLLRTPSHDELQRRRAEAYQQFDREHPRSTK
ncbi:hypothetical protein [Cellulosimicrobium cellulans]|uniref:hypothetical protein n=1 Tax=Cellulosimicrobium cellulans TaxID=1710 RepID=UPI00240612BB|nr:hypothetical protein [Cellulosimicrobium cellulans]MDF9877475.1 hypothetical protein [Cellulosimicrobium cellulans]